MPSDDGPAGDSAKLLRLSETEALEQARRRQEAAFTPSPIIEALVLQVIGGWEQLKATVNMYRFLEAGPEGEWTGKENLPASLNKLAMQHRIRWPHDRFAASVNHANKIRQRLAHFLYLSAVVGDESPDRTMYFTRIGKPGSAPSSRDQAGLEWRDDEWAQQHRQEDHISEQELRGILAELNWLIDCCHALKRLAGQLAHNPDLLDDHPITTAGWFIPWRTDTEPLLTLRRAPYE